MTAQLACTPADLFRLNIKTIICVAALSEQDGIARILAEETVRAGQAGAVIKKMVARQAENGRVRSFLDTQRPGTVILGVTNPVSPKINKVYYSADSYEA